MHLVFISHASADRDIALRVCACLEGHGVACWVAPRDIPAGALWGEAILDAISQASIFLILVSADANASSHVLRELERAASKKKTIIPIVLDGCIFAKSFEYFLSPCHFLNIDTHFIDDNLPQLLSSVLHLLSTEGSSTNHLLDSKRGESAIAVARRPLQHPDSWGRTNNAGFLRRLFAKLDDR